VDMQRCAASNKDNTGLFTLQLNNTNIKTLDEYCLDKRIMIN